MLVAVTRSQVVCHCKLDADESLCMRYASLRCSHVQAKLSSLHSIHTILQVQLESTETTTITSRDVCSLAEVHCLMQQNFLWNRQMNKMA